MSNFTVNIQASMALEAESAADAVAQAQAALPDGAAIQSIQVIPAQEQH